MYMVWHLPIGSPLLVWFLGRDVDSVTRRLPLWYSHDDYQSR